MIVWQFHARQSDPQLDTFMDALIAVIEERGLTLGGGTDAASGSGFVCRAKRGSAQEADRRYLESWLHDRPEVAFVHVDELEDAWNPDTRQYQHIIDLLESESDMNKPTRVIMPPESGI